ncbi:MAG TPA: DUF1080 domain-containing protein [Vicinamibacterales bacterium]
MRTSRYERRGALGYAIAAIAVCAACSDPNPSAPGSTDEPQGPNTLTAAERAAGWRLLFDGRTTSGWRGFKQAGMPGGWQVAGGALTRVSGGGDVITIDQFANFELAIEWQIAPGGNSGIMYRVSEAADSTFQTGPEMQVLDNAGHPDGASPLSSAGACYGLYPPASNVTRPVGSWNEVRIIANGTHVEHWLNGVKIVEYELFSPDWLARLQASPHRDATRYGREPSGYIALQDHGDRVAYRSIKIRVL